MSKTVITARNISKRYRIGVRKVEDTLAGKLKKGLSYPIRNLKRISSLNSFNDETDESIFWALKDIEFEVKEGEVLGIIGKNGAGKSTLLKILSRITEPTTGRIEIKGRVSSLLEVGTGFHPELTGRDNVYMNGTIHGMTRKEINRKFDEIVEFSGIQKHVDTPVKFYSSGMKVRLGFAVAAHLEPEILVIDEVLAVGDAEFQRKCLGKMNEVSRSGRTVLFVSHNMGAVKNLCTRSILLQSGKLLKEGKTDEIIDVYLKTNSATFGKIEHTKARSGNQKVIFSDFHLENSQGQRVDLALTGEPITLVFELKVNSNEMNKVDLGFSLHSNMDTMLSVLYSSYQGTYVQGLKEGYNQVRCTLPSVDFGQGVIYVKGRIVENGEEADWPKDIIGKIPIEMGNYYGTGSNGFRQNVPFLIKGNWHSIPKISNEVDKFQL